MHVFLARVLKGEASPEEVAAVLEWRRASPENEIEYRDLVRLVELAARTPELVPAAPRPSARELIRPGDAMPPAIALRRRARRWGGAPWWLAAAAVAVFAGVYLAWPRTPASAFGIREIVTSEGETATLELLDGTVVRLAPLSRLRVRAGPGAREVALEGRGFFAVAKQRGAPFAIHTDVGEVSVLGTRLDLEARGPALRLVVVEGRVALSTTHDRTELTAGEMGRVVRGETTAVVAVPDVGPFVEWTGDFLAFQSTPLRDAAREVERVYGVRVEIPDEELAERVITAWFWDRSLAEVIDVVCLAVAARCTTGDGVVRMLSDVHGGGR